MRQNEAESTNTLMTSHTEQRVRAGELGEPELCAAEVISGPEFAPKKFTPPSS